VGWTRELAVGDRVAYYSYALGKYRRGLVGTVMAISPDDEGEARHIVLLDAPTWDGLAVVEASLSDLLRLPARRPKTGE
jgi:hypothetical protein